MSTYLQNTIANYRARIASLEKESADLERRLEDLSLEIVKTVSAAEAYEDALRHGETGGEDTLESTATLSNAQPGQSGYWTAVLSTLRSKYAGTEFDTTKVLAELKRMGRPLQRKTTRSRLGEFVRAGKLIRVRDGLYRFPPESGSQGPKSNGPPSDEDGPETGSVTRMQPRAAPWNNPQQSRAG